jgi:hypothetical protein
MVFGITEAGGEFNYDVNFSIYITFQGVQELQGVPAIPFIAKAISEVECIVRATETEVHRIGLV